MTKLPATKLQSHFRVAVLSGGKSAERAVSLESGAAVAQALAGRGHAVAPFDPAETDVATIDWRSFDAAFLALHGTYGEDGRIQSQLEELGVPFTGSDSATSRLAFSKSASKERFAQFGVPTPAYVLVNQADEPARIRRLAETIGYPLVVKPDAQGSSLGVSIIPSPDQLPQALAHCFQYDSFALLETYVAGSEWTIGLFDDEVLPLIQIETTRPFFDFQAKYEDDATQYRFEFSLPAPVVKAIEAAGRGAGVALGTKGLARVDLRLDTDARPWVLEINTIPGFTNHSLIPKAATRIGIPFGELCERAIEACLPAAKTGGASNVPKPKLLNRTALENGKAPAGKAVGVCRTADNAMAHWENLTGAD